MDENKEPTSGTIQEWIKDNLRIIISVIIVVAIAGGIYSYSKRSQPPVGEELAVTEEAEEEAIEEEMTNEEAIEVEEEETAAATEEEQEMTTEEVGETQEQITAAATSKETEGSFIETAGRGDGTTHLARRALANYLEKNPDSELTAEHKIYIEDYLRKNAEFHDRVFVGTSVEFNKDLITEAISKSKELNENQLKNLEKYSALVPSLS